VQARREEAMLSGTMASLPKRGTTAEIDERGASSLAASLLDPNRDWPIVGVTARSSAESPDVDAAALARKLPGATVVVLRTGAATWALTDALPDGLDVYGGACRIWRPGLSKESNRRDHPLFFSWSPEEGVEVAQRIVDALEPEQPASVPRRAVVEHVDRGEIIVRVERDRGPITQSDTPLLALAACVRPGLALPVVRLGRGADGRIAFSTSGVLPTGWQRVAECCEPGDVVLGKVEKLGDLWARIELLPGAAVMVPIGEVDWDRVNHPADVLTRGEVVPVQLLELDVANKRGRGSIRKGRAVASPRELSLVEGGPSFTAPPMTETDETVESALRDRIGALEGELESVRRDLGDMESELRGARRQADELRRSLRQAGSAHENDEDERALHSERDFMRAVRVAHARQVDEGERFAHPLQHVRVGREFLASVRALEGVSIQKIVEVCAQVASHRAHLMPGRDVHPLREGAAGQPSRTRAADGARAWRCSLQDNTPGARRLHWWDVPGKEGRTIELASVGHHDEYDIPE
jgi:hypothetical protein